jgi:hypothetical protein
MRRGLSTSGVLAIVLLVVPFAFARSAPRDESTARGMRQARLEWRDGSTMIVSLEGIGCSQSMCSRLTHVAAIRDICEESALFVFRNGTERRVMLDRDNRVLYATASGGAMWKIELLHLRSVELDAGDAR